MLLIIAVILLIVLFFYCPHETHNLIMDILR